MSKQNNLDKYDFELFFELSPDLMCIAGYDGYFKKVNPAVAKVLGYTTEELYAKPIHEFIYIEDQEITGRHRSHLINNNPLLNFENRYVTKEGEIIWLSWTSMPLDTQKIVYAVAKNITHKRKQEDDRNHLLSHLTVVNDDLKLLTYTTSHDLRAPVNNLLSVFSLLDSSKIEDQETLEFIDILKSATESLKSKLNTHLEILNQKQTLQVQIEELDINDILNSVIQSLSSLLKSSGATLNINLSEVKYLKFNRAYLESIFLNLITNAIKYAKPDSTPFISIVSKNNVGIKQLIISDQGQGFDTEKLKDKIFKINQTFHTHPESKGIGLYLVYNHIISLGGHITLESKVNNGSTFTLTFKD